MLYRKLVRSLLFRLSQSDPEIAHELALGLLSVINHLPGLCAQIRRWTLVADPRLSQEFWGLSFVHPIGLAAGFDKNGEVLTGLAALGFSHIEMGTITAFAQEGKPRPRMFRFPDDEALINRMGFNNDSADRVRSAGKKIAIPLGISIGKGVDTPLRLASTDYKVVLTKLYAYGDYFVVNVSSPNTEGLRALQAKEELRRIINDLQQVLMTCGSWDRKPLLVKISPDLTWAQIDEVIEVCLAYQINGIIATNTTLSRAGLREPTFEAGGMSGRPLFPRALEVVRYLRKNLPKSFPIIGVGGIMSADNAYEMLKAGANLLQVYTGFVYGGPFFVRELNRGLVALIERDGVTHISQLHV